MQQYILEKSKRPDKKYTLIIKNGDHQKHINFGASGYEDYTQHHDNFRKIFYQRRHQNEKSKFWGHDTEISPAYLSRWILWEYPNIKDAIKFVEEKRGIKIQYHI